MCKNFFSTFDYMKEAYQGPVVNREGICGQANVFQLNSLNGVDYFPPRRCLPSSSGEKLILAHVSSSDGINTLPKRTVKYDSVYKKVSVQFDCSRSTFCKQLAKKCDAS